VKSIAAGGVDQLSSIGIDPNDDLVAGSISGNVLLTTTALTSLSSFTITEDVTIHVGSTTPLISSVLEPSSIVLAGIAGVFDLGFWSRCRAPGR
jgi:hypothetical protein